MTADSSADIEHGDIPGFAEFVAESDIKDDEADAAAWMYTFTVERGIEPASLESYLMMLRSFRENTNWE